MKFLIKYPVASWVAAIGLALLLAVPGVAAHAQDQDPFQTDAGIWKSFDRYKEEQKNKLLSEITGNLDADTKAAAARDAAESQESQSESRNNIADTTKDKKAGNTTPSVAQAADTKSALAPPERPLVLPTMPALTARFNLTVDTTVDDQKPVAHVAHIDTDPDLQLPSQNWLNAAQAAQLHAEGKDEGDDTVPLNIRYPFLPSFRAPSPQHKVVPATAVAQVKPPPAPESAADNAACAAIDAYKKRELEAIQSDRHTLSALQAAIAELGLKKELNFMAGQDSKIDMPEDNGTPKSAAP